MGKIKKKNKECEEEKRMSINDIQNKTIRRNQVMKIKIEKKKEKKAERKKRKAAGEKPGIPHTIESLRVKDETVLDPTVKANEERIEEANIDIETDEFQDYYQKKYEPKVLITYNDCPLKKSRVFGIELSRMIPNSLSRYRQHSSIKKIVKDATAKNFTDIVVINEDRGEPNGLLIIHLPSGPTAYFRMSNVKITTELKKNHKEITSHRPEVILDNFTTRLGTTVSRMLGALFHYDPEFKGRRAVTFHNQRDYIFFRHHRYEFKQNGKPFLKELGPRFTLRLEYLQTGTFDTKLGEFEWVKAGRRRQLESNRRKFNL